MTAASARAFTHLPLFDEPQTWQTGIYRRRMAFTLVAAHAPKFRADFVQWLEANYSAWEAFEREADKIWNAGRRHYSARTIGEVLRHESALREKPNTHGWKLNDHYWPDLARLYALLHPDRDKFFELRVNPLSVRGA